MTNLSYETLEELIKQGIANQGFATLYGLDRDESNAIKVYFRGRYDVTGPGINEEGNLFNVNKYCLKFMPLKKIQAGEQNA